MSQSKVSVLCITYNHENFIRQCLESILSQQTDFEFELIIHDDASTDKTVDIINEYRAKDPRVKLIAQTKNQFQQGVRGMFLKFLLPLVKSQYIATCEGDDYFFDNQKLQRQVDFLDANSDHTVCFHPVKVVTEGSNKYSVFPTKELIDRGIKLKDLLHHNFIQTNSAMYRRVDYADLSKANFMPSDWYLHIYHAAKGSIGILDQAMSVYRRHPGGVWSFDSQKQKMRKVGDMNILMYVETLKLLSEHENLKNVVYGNIIGLSKRVRQAYVD